MTLRRYFQQSAILSVTLTLTFRSLSIPESQFSRDASATLSYTTLEMASRVLLSSKKPANGILSATCYPHHFGANADSYTISVIFLCLKILSCLSLAGRCWNFLKQEFTGTGYCIYGSVLTLLSISLKSQHSIVS